MATSKKLDVRQLIRSQRENTKTRKKIESPLARYNSSGQLFCVLCNQPVKNELLWDAHVQGKKHKENFIEFKNKKAQAAKSGLSQKSSTHTTNPVGKFASPAVVTSVVKRKIADTNDDSRSSIPEKKSKDSPSLKGSLNTQPGLPEDFFDKPSGTSTLSLKSSENNTTPTQTEVQKSSASSELPADFFDSPHNLTKVQEEEKPDNKSREKKIADKAIPEGFFDDPKLDAKARNVEYKDPAEVEWEKFQREMSMQNQISEALIEEDDEEARIERAMSELSEQRLYYLRADMLREKQIEARQQKNKKAAEEKEVLEGDTDSDEDFEEFLDWRAKKAV